MPEGDTLFRTAAGLRPYLVGRTVTAARTAARERSRRSRASSGARSRGRVAGKNLLIRFDNGLEIRTHLRMNGSWHRYRPGERWRRPAGARPARDRGPGAVAVCFDAPVVELSNSAPRYSTRRSGGSGRTCSRPISMPTEALRRLRDPSRAGMSIAEALLDQRALAGIGNIWKNETLWTERVSPFVASVPSTRRHSAAGRDGAPAPPRQRGTDVARVRAALRLRSQRPAVSALRDGDRQRASREPRSRGRPIGARPASRRRRRALVGAHQ